MNLYELTGRYLQIIQLSDELDEDLLQDTLESIQEPLETKMANIVKVIRSIEADIVFIEKEEKRIRALKESKQKTILRLKNMLLDAVEQIGQETKTGGHKVVIKNDAFVKSIYTQKSPPSVEVLDVAALDPAYKIEQPPKVDSKAILAAWKETNQEVAGVRINQNMGVRYK